MHNFFIFSLGNIAFNFFSTFKAGRFKIQGFYYLFFISKTAEKGLKNKEKTDKRNCTVIFVQIKVCLLLSYQHYHICPSNNTYQQDLSPVFTVLKRGDQRVHSQNTPCFTVHHWSIIIDLMKGKSRLGIFLNCKFYLLRVLKAFIDLHPESLHPQPPSFPTPWDRCHTHTPYLSHGHRKQKQPIILLY